MSRNMPLRELWDFQREPLGQTKGYRSKEVELQRKAKRDGIIPSRRTETHTPTSGHVSPDETDPMEAAIWEEGPIWRGSKGRNVQTDPAARAKTAGNYSNRIHKTCQLPLLRSKLGERPRSHTPCTGSFYVARQLVPAFYLPDNLTPIYGFVQVKSRLKPPIELDRLFNRQIDDY
jgi:hypothetical protein